MRIQGSSTLGRLGGGGACDLVCGKEEKSVQSKGGVVVSCEPDVADRERR